MAVPTTNSLIPSKSPGALDGSGWHLPARVYMELEVSQDLEGFVGSPYNKGCRVLRFSPLFGNSNSRFARIQLGFLIYCLRGA